MPEGEIRIGSWSLHLGDLRLKHGRCQRRLRPKDLDVLLQLAEAAPEMVTTEALLARSWHGTVVSDGAVYQSVSRLRRALSGHSGGDTYIETLPKHGYRLTVPVQLPDKPPRSLPTPPRRAGSAGRGHPMPASIAILPLALPADDPAAAEFVDGLVEDLASGLCTLGEFNVACHGSVVALSERDAGVEEIADHLGVRYLLEGGLRRCGPRVRINLQLIDAHTNWFVVWAGQFTRRMTDTFDLQDEISEQVVQALVRCLSGNQAVAS